METEIKLGATTRTNQIYNFKNEKKKASHNRSLAILMTSLRSILKLELSFAQQFSQKLTI